MDTSLSELKAKFVSISEDLAVIESKLNDEFSMAFGASQNPATFPYRLSLLKLQYQQLEKELQELYPQKEAVAVALSKQLANYKILHALQTRGKVEIPKQFENIALDGYFVLKRWKNAKQSETAEAGKVAVANESIGESQVEKQEGSVFSSEVKQEPWNTLPSECVPSFNAGQSKGVEPVLAAADDDGFKPITESAFLSVPKIIRRRCNLDDLNTLYKCIWKIIQKRGSFYAIQKKELVQHNIKVYGQTGEAKLSTLKHLKVILTDNKDGSIRLLKDYYPPFQKTYTLKRRQLGKGISKK